MPSPATTAAPSTSQAESASKRPSGEPPPVVREAKLIRRVSVDYPSAAKRDGIEGTVDLAVTVSAKGVVESVSVAHADPPDVFDKAALDAIRRWKYEPRYEDGLPAEANLKVHVEFKGGEVNY
jgi:TonB family protein